MNLQEILKKNHVLTQDSRSITSDSIFFAIEGSAKDGHGFVEQVLKDGAYAAVVRNSHPTTTLLLTDRKYAKKLICVSDTREALALAACAKYENPSHRMKVVGVTGTNGKTTSTYLLEAVLRAANLNTAVIGTVENRLGTQIIPATHTTPDAPALQKLFADFYDAGATAIAMEVSSHALDQKRTWGTKFAAALFTNLTQDHLDYHHTMDKYFAAKAALFLNYEVATRAIHSQDTYGKKIFDLCRQKGLPAFSFASSGANVNYAKLQCTTVGIHGPLQIDWPALPRFEIQINSPLLGAFNAQNIAGAVTVGLALGIDADRIGHGLRSATQVPGRMERIENKKDLNVVVDYAHTPDALEKALRTLHDLKPKKIICIFGCGGDRDKSKRPLMAKAAERLADQIIITSDNPRTEDPEQILNDIETGFSDKSKVTRIADRRKAIAEGICKLQKGEALLIAGKGHEDYQIIGTEKTHFDDRSVAKEYL